jgi:autotransporter passenger strand-loop-strand repeat protein
VLAVGDYELAIQAFRRAILRRLEPGAGLVVGLVLSGGALNVLSGGTAIGTTVNKGGTERVSGRDFGATLNGGLEVVSRTGVASGTTLVSGGSQTDLGKVMCAPTVGDDRRRQAQDVRNQAGRALPTTSERHRRMRGRVARHPEACCTAGPARDARPVRRHRRHTVESFYTGRQPPAEFVESQSRGRWAG